MLLRKLKLRFCFFDSFDGIVDLVGMQIFIIFILATFVNVLAKFS